MRKLARVTENFRHLSTCSLCGRRPEVGDLIVIDNGRLHNTVRCREHYCDANGVPIL